MPPTTQMRLRLVGLDLDHLPAVAGDLRSLSDADPDGQTWARAMATTLLEARRAAVTARAHGAETLDGATLKSTRDHYRGALARRETDNHSEASAKAAGPRSMLQ